MAGRNPYFNTWSHPTRKDDTYETETNFHTTEDNSGPNSLDEAVTLNEESIDDSEGATSKYERNLEDITSEIENDSENINESLRGVSVSDNIFLEPDIEFKSDMGGAPNRVDADEDLLRVKRVNELHGFRPESNYTPKTTKGSKRIQSTGGSIYQKDRQKDVFLLYVSDGKSIAMDLSAAFERNGIKWYEYEKDFNPSHTIFYDLSVFLFTCKRTVAVLSPGFYKSGLFMYFLQTTVRYCVDHGKNALIPILSDTKPSDLHTWLSVFTYMKCDHRNWTEDLLKVLTEKVQPLKCKGDHLWDEGLRTISSCKSEPAYRKDKLSKSTEREIKIWFKTKFSELPQEFQNGTSDENENEDIGTTETVAAKRGVNSEIMFASKLRHENKKVYDSAITFIEDGFDVTAGDILEVLETCEDGKYVKVRNSRGQETTMPKTSVLPNIFYLPKIAVEWVKHPITKAENDAFETELRSAGIEVLTAVDSSPSYAKTFEKNDIFAKINETGQYVNVKNCRNEILHLKKQYLKKVQRDLYKLP